MMQLDYAMIMELRRGHVTLNNSRQTLSDDTIKGIAIGLLVADIVLKVGASSRCAVYILGRERFISQHPEWGEIQSKARRTKSGDWYHKVFRSSGVNKCIKPLQSNRYES